MTEKATIADEMRRKIGAEAPPVTLEIEKGAVRKFAQAIGDPNPLWQDEEYAKKAGYDGIMAPPSFLCTNGAGFGEFRGELGKPGKRMIVEDELEFLQPVKVGDVITCKQRFVELREREGKKGTQLFVVFEHIFTNQKGETVAKGKATYLWSYSPS